MTSKATEALNAIRQEVRQMKQENLDNIKEARNKLNALISATPTGELRNTYTDINILFESIIQNYEDHLDMKAKI